jgi:hypothetical protein
LSRGPRVATRSIQAELDGKVVDWLEPVTEAQYRATPDTSE